MSPPRAARTTSDETVSTRMSRGSKSSTRLLGWVLATGEFSGDQRGAERHVSTRSGVRLWPPMDFELGAGT